MHELFDPRLTYAAPSNAQLVFGGGPLLDSVKLVGVYIEGFPYASSMSSFLDWIPTSDIFKNLGEYNVGAGSHEGDVHLSLGGGTPPPPPPPPPCHRKRRGSGLMDLVINRHIEREAAAGTQVVTDSDLQSFLAKNIASGALPKNDAETLYCVFLPDGITVQMDAQDASCTTFCGYHSNFQDSEGNQVFYAILPFPSCSGCQGGLSELDALTSVTTHEIAEAVTDPIPGQGWYDQANGEIGDICAWQQRQDGSFVVQLLWSNQANSCM